ncbi:MAG: glucosamine-6-phosphate isomerase [Clostridiales bacterium]|nr:glucosamine-6-phosphate isomerase [Clostridiales bacterium]
MNLLTTIKGSMLENYFPEGWDLEKIDECCSHSPEEITERQSFWNKDFTPISCASLSDFDTMMGHEIAMQIRETKEDGRKLVLILPVGPVGMYRWAVFFLKQWNIDCSHVYGFNMDEWGDAEGNTLAPDDPGAFQNTMETIFYGPLGDLTVPEDQRNFATKENLPTYGPKIEALKAEGAKLVTIFGIGRAFHIAFWEPHFALDYDSVEEWKSATHRVAAKLHPFTIEQNAITSFKSRTTMVPARANTVGPGLFLQSDYIIGGCDGAPGRGMMWQGMSLWVALRYGPDIWVPASFMPTLPGKLFFLEELAGPLGADVN